MKKKIYRILSVLMCIQILFGFLPVSDLHLHGDDHDHDRGGLLVTTARAWDEDLENDDILTEKLRESPVYHPFVAQAQEAADDAESEEDLKMPEPRSGDGE